MRDAHLNPKVPRAAFPRVGGALPVVTLVVAIVLQAPSGFGDEPTANEPTYRTYRLQGRVVWLAEALARRFGVKTVPEAAERVLALETAGGELHPIIEDVRGRAFRRDERLRKMQVELLVRQHDGSPLIQIVRVWEVTSSGKLEVDYWCEICSIAMFELQQCDCCQGPIELRKQPVDESGPARD